MYSMIDLNGIKIKSPLVLAPIAGYTDSPFRRICLEEGAGLAVSELISSEGIVRHHEKTLSMMRYHPSEHPFGIQIFGNDPDVMARAALYTESTGVDFVDLNMGCPAKKVCRDGTGSGSALLRDPDLIYEITKAVRGALSIPVTAKIRTGWDLNSINYTETVSALQEGGITFIAVHGRTKSQGYNGSADWEIMTKIKEYARVPIVANGDIAHYHQALERQEEGNFDAVMIGRAAIGNPWIFSGSDPSLEGKKRLIIRHLDMMIEFFGQYGIVLMRKHFLKYIQGIPNASNYRKLLSTASERAAVIEILNSIEAH